MLTQTNSLASTKSETFPVALMQELLRSVFNSYGEENWDEERFGAHKSSLKSSVLIKANELLSGKIAMVSSNLNHEIEKLSAIQPSLDKLSSLYNLLEDEYSKSTLVKVLAYRIMGYKRVKLPLNTRDYWSARELAQSLIRGSDSISIRFGNWSLNRFELADIGYPIELFFRPGGILATFMLKQYEYQRRNPAIRAKDADYVIDAGGCWGDTALYFAHNVGDRGKVYTFEFVPENLEVFQRNMDLNPELSERITLVRQALWEKSGEEIAYSSNGPGTSLNSRRENSLLVSTVSIDDFVTKENLPRVDFIKMDIEGAELQSLKGAEQTIRTFRPQLAVSVYHKETDLAEIPDYLDSLGVGYEFFLDHFTIHTEETLLFATPKLN